MFIRRGGGGVNVAGLPPAFYGFSTKQGDARLAAWVSPVDQGLLPATAAAPKASRNTVAGSGISPEWASQVIS